MPAFSWNELQKRLKNNQQCEVTLEKTLSLWACIISAAGVGAYGTPEVHGIIPVWFTGQNEVDSQKGNANGLILCHDVDVDRKTDEYATDSDWKYLPVSVHEDETVFLCAITSRSVRTG